MESITKYLFVTSLLSSYTGHEPGDKWKKSLKSQEAQETRNLLR